MNKNKPLTFKSVFSGSTICIIDESLDFNAPYGQIWPDFEYCITTDTDSSYRWKKYLTHDTINVLKGESISFRAAANGNETLEAIQFKMTGYFEASGNIQYLLDPTGQRSDVPDRCYSGLFDGCASLLEPPELPATKIGIHGYTFMFRNCINLRYAPALPATVLSYGCYYYMFCGCTSLTQASAILPATTLADWCYASMFQGCKSLIKAPELPATSLAKACYGSMFQSCTSLTQAPALPAETLAESCYNFMFYDCTALIQAPDLLAIVLLKNCYAFMFDRCIMLKHPPNFPDLILTAHKTALQDMFRHSAFSNFEPLILTYDD